MEGFEIIDGTGGEPLNRGYLSTVEESLELTFPPGYVNFLTKSNGGVPVKKYFSVMEKDKVIERFLSLVPDYKENKLGMYDIEVVWGQIEDRLNDHLVPFAVLFAGDFLCFDMEIPLSPAIVLWDHELSTDGDPVLFPVASTFEEFLTLVH